MSKSLRKARMNAYLLKMLRKQHAVSNLSQEALAEKLDLSSRACSALENGKSGFSAISFMMLFTLFPKEERISLFIGLCETLELST